MMSHGHSHAMEVRNPGTLKVSPALWGALGLLAVIGLATFSVGLFFETKRAWASFLMNHFYFFSLALGGLFFASIQWLTGAMWSAPMRRVFESFTAYIPAAFISFLVIAFGGMHTLYKWTHPEIVKADALLTAKMGYLNTPFMIGRNVLGFAIWAFFAWFMVGNSLKQDQTKSYTLTLRNKSFSPVFLILFGVMFTLASFDLLMSLDPHWYSTMFGVYCFAGLFYSTLALACIIVICLRRSGALEGIVNTNHIHDLGKFMFAFTVFWAYIGISQFMLIWYANLPEETFWYIDRLSHGWLYVSVYLLIVKFMVPFLVLLPRGRKRNETTLIGVGVVMLISQWVDMLWLVQPQFFEEGPHIGWVEILMFAGFWGIFGLFVTFFLSRNTVVAIGDPRLPESVFHHHQ